MCFSVQRSLKIIYIINHKKQKIMKAGVFILSILLAIGFIIAGIALIQSDFEIWKWAFIVISFLAAILYSIGAWKVRPWQKETSLN